MEHSLTRQEVKELAEYLGRIVDEIPAGLSTLKEAATFAEFDLNCFAIRGIKTSTYTKALAFAQSIPHATDVKDDIITTWMLTDVEYKKYYP